MSTLLVGLVVLGRYFRPSISNISQSGIIPLPTGKACVVNKISKTEAIQIMVNAKNKMKIDNNSSYIEVSGISEEDLEEIALTYGVIGNKECGPKIFVNFQKGEFLQLEGENWEKWFWTVNACVNNKRVIIDPLTDEQVGTIHTYVICGGVI